MSITLQWICVSAWGCCEGKHLGAQDWAAWFGATKSYWPQHTGGPQGEERMPASFSSWMNALKDNPGGQFLWRSSSAEQILPKECKAEGGPRWPSQGQRTWRTRVRRGCTRARVGGAWMSESEGHLGKSTLRGHCPSRDRRGGFTRCGWALMRLPQKDPENGLLPKTEGTCRDFWHESSKIKKYFLLKNERARRDEGMGILTHLEAPHTYVEGHATVKEDFFMVAFRWLPWFACSSLTTNIQHWNRCPICHSWQRDWKDQDLLEWQLLLKFQQCKYKKELQNNNILLTLCFPSTLHTKQLKALMGRSPSPTVALKVSRKHESHP